MTELGTSTLTHEFNIVFLYCCHAYVVVLNEARDFVADCVCSSFEVGHDSFAACVPYRCGH